MQNKGAKPNPASFTPLLCCLMFKEQMEKTFSCTLLLLSWSTISSKYVYIEDKMTWHKAQSFCREHHADLAPVSNIKDNQILEEKRNDRSWIGLYRNSTHRDKWRWSGGGEASAFFWASDQPDQEDEDYVMLYDDGWHNSCPDHKVDFFCYSPIVVRKRKTWEEAMGYCRQHHRDLASLLSETEMMLMSKKLLKTQNTEPLWIGLHFFSGKWLWVDSGTSSYKAWGQSGKPGCPDSKQVCAALRMKGTNSMASSKDDADVAFGADDFVFEWEARNCDDQLPSICY